jgi:hypothetical protein
MGAILHDKKDKQHELLINWRGWRPTVRLIRTLGLFTEEQLTLMTCNVNVEIDKQKASAIADFIEQQVLTGLWRSADDSELDGILADPDFREWFQRFVVFCRASDGFYVG